MFISQYPELSPNTQKYPDRFVYLFIMKSWVTGIKASFSGLKGCPLGNLDYIILHSRFSSSVVFILLAQLPGSVYNQSTPTISQLS